MFGQLEVISLFEMLNKYETLTMAKFLWPDVRAPLKQWGGPTVNHCIGATSPVLPCLN